MDYDAEDGQEDDDASQNREGIPCKASVIDCGGGSLCWCLVMACLPHLRGSLAPQSAPGKQYARQSGQDYGVHVDNEMLRGCLDY